MAPKTTAPPTKNDAVLGRGGGKNNFRKDSLFRKLIEDNWVNYCEIENFKSADKRKFVKEFVVDPILKQGGRFLKFQKQKLQELLPANPQDSKELYKRIAQCLRDEKKKKSHTDKVLKERLAASPAIVRPSSQPNMFTMKLAHPGAPTTTAAKTPAKTTRSKKSSVVTVEKPAPTDRHVVFSGAVEQFEGDTATVTPQSAMMMINNDEASFVSLSDSSSAYTKAYMSDSSFNSNSLMSDDSSSVFSDFDAEPLPIDYQCFRSVSDVYSNLLTWEASSSSGHDIPFAFEDDQVVDVNDLLPELDPATLDAVHHPGFTSYHPALDFGEDNAEDLMEPLCEFDGFPEFCSF